MYTNNHVHYNTTLQGSNHGTLWCKGFKATNGWDPASGWGSPNFGILRELVSESQL